MEERRGAAFQWFYSKQRRLNEEIKRAMNDPDSSQAVSFLQQVLHAVAKIRHACSKRKRSFRFEL
jgi:hypothetical protein